MFGWVKRKRSTDLRADFQDEVLGSVVWDPEEEAWVTCVPQPPFRILLAGEGRPDPRLVSHARDIFSSPDKLTTAVTLVLASAAKDLPIASTEILGLSVESVALMWPDRPDDGMVYLDGPDTDGRVWRCDYIGRQPQGLGFDD